MEKSEMERETRPMKICDIVQAWGPFSGGVKSHIEDKIHYIAGQQALEHVLIIPGPADRQHAMKLPAASNGVSGGKDLSAASGGVLDPGFAIKRLRLFRPVSSN